MFAVIKTGGKQYRVAPGDVIVVEKLAGEPGGAVTFDNVLMLGEDGKAPAVGAPTVADAKVVGEVVDQSRADKVIVFKRKRRQTYRRTKGHRQLQTVLHITEISGAGMKGTAEPMAKKATAKKPAAAEAKEAKPAAKKPAAKKATEKKAAPAKKAAPKKAAPKTTAKKPAAKKPAAKKPAAKKAASGTKAKTTAKKPAAKKSTSSAKSKSTTKKS